MDILVNNNLPTSEKYSGSPKNMAQPLVTSKPHEKEVSLANIFLTFLKLGLTAFGPAMMGEAKKI